jgi:hypothetical protein
MIPGGIVLGGGLDCPGSLPPAEQAGGGGGGSELQPGIVIAPNTAKARQEAQVELMEDLYLRSARHGCRRMPLGGAADFFRDLPELVWLSDCRSSERGFG